MQNMSLRLSESSQVSFPRHCSVGGNSHIWAGQLWPSAYLYLAVLCVQLGSEVLSPVGSNCNSIKF